MKPHAIEFKSPLELSAQGEFTIHTQQRWPLTYSDTHALNKLQNMHLKKIIIIQLQKLYLYIGYGDLSNKHLHGRSHTVWRVLCAMWTLTPTLIHATTIDLTVIILQLKPHYLLPLFLSLHWTQEAHLLPSLFFYLLLSPVDSTQLDLHCWG